MALRRSKTKYLAVFAAVAAACTAGCDREGPAVEANPQTIVFLPIEQPAVDQPTVAVSAMASSGLAVRYRSLTLAVCSVDGSTGLVTGLASGTCTVAADQPGNSHFAPAPQVSQDIVFVLTAVDPGQGPVPPADGVINYSVVETFYEPDTQPNNSIFVGTFTLDATTGTVSNLQGRLSESMTGGATPYPGDTMTWVPLQHQLSSIPVMIDGAKGLLVTTFKLPSTDTLSSAELFGGTDGFSPGTGMGLYFGYPGPNPGNAYARIFVNLSDPTAVPTQAQIDMLAYADCTPGGMMGATCMTGISIAGYGSVGSMSGHPLSQTITKP
jgi:hypothetical protein